MWGSPVLFPNIEEDYILLLGYSILYKECNPTRLNHQKNISQYNPNIAPTYTLLYYNSFHFLFHYPYLTRKKLLKWELEMDRDI